MVRSCQRIRAHTFVTTPIFPTEVCEMIIDKVGDDIFEPCSQSQWSQPRAKALSSCALVAPSWLPRSRVHLFRDVCLSSEWRTERFIEALIHSPSLGKHVYTLRIKPDTVEDSQKWIHRILLYLPRLLPHLYHLQFFNLPVLHRSFVVLASRFTSVESLELSGLQAQSFGEIIQLINRYPHLDRLSIVDCKWRIPSRYLSRKQHEITKLTLRNDPDYQKEALNWVLASRSTLTLRVFCSISKLSSHGLEEQVLRTCLSTFQEIAIVGSITERKS